MPFLIELPIVSVVHRATGLVYVRAEVAMTVVPSGNSYPFLVDTGCAVTTVDEAVAAALGIPPGGSPVSVRGATAAGTGRVVPVRFRFSDEIDYSGTTQQTRLGLEVDSHWVVVPSGVKRVALIGFQDVHRHYAMTTDPDNLYLCRWADVGQLS